MARQVLMRSAVFVGLAATPILVAPASAVALGPAAPPPLFDGLGPVARRIATTSPQAQRYFNQGLAFLYAFNHDEAIRAFRHAAVLDPASPMPLWGLALAMGPHINNMAVPPEREKEAFDALQKARALAVRADAPLVERNLLVALSSRYADPQPADRGPLNQAYAVAMRDLWTKYPKDADIGALFAESLANLRPWDLWLKDGSPQPGTEELVATIEGVLKLSPKHPFANHLLIHAVEASPNPGKADAAADALRGLQPALGHMEHMPSHIDVRRGRWRQAIVSNAAAIASDRRYSARVPDQGFYRLYMSHNHHMLAFAAMMTGESALAIRTLREMVADIPEEFFRANAWADGLKAAPLEAQMRFGRWDEILGAPRFPEYAPISRSIQRYARGIAFLAQGDADSARREQQAFMEERARVPKDAAFGNNTGSDLLDVAEKLMGGEILFQSGQIEDGLNLLRDAVTREDGLRYNEPPDWIQPTRHALGAALLRAGRYAEAEQVFRDDLMRLPENGWGLFGLGRALRLQKRDGEAAAIEKRFSIAWRRADMKIKSACLCLPGV